MTESDYAEWLRAFKFEPYCPMCRHLRYDKRGKFRCRSFNHFGSEWDYEQEKRVLA